MIMSMELHRPRLTPVLPQWNLGIVLEALSKSPCEPLREASLKHLTLKTVVLLAMASAGKCSEIQALVFDPQYIQFNLREPVSRYILHQSSYEKIRGLTRSMTLGTFQQFQMLNQMLGHLTAQ